MIIILFLIFSLGFVLLCEIREVAAINKVISPIMAMALYIIVIVLTEYNNDWRAYELMYEGVIPTFDLAYDFLMSFARDSGLTYRQFYILNQLLNCVLLVNILVRLKPESTYLAVFTLLVLCGANVSILLRFITAYLIFINGLYYFIIPKRKTLGILFFLLAILAHFGASVLIIIFILFHQFKIYIWSIYKVIILGFLLALSKSFIFYLLNKINFGSFAFYISESSSSLKGGLLAAIPVIPWILVPQIIHFTLVKKNIQLGKTYYFLYNFSRISLILIFLSFTLQIVLHRFIEPSVIFFVFYLVYSFKYIKSSTQLLICATGIIIMIFITFFLKYQLPLFVLGSSEWTEHYMEILESNKFLN